MGPLLTTVGILLIFAIVIGLMWLGWSLRRRRQKSFPSAPELPIGLGQPTMAIDDAHYVATSIAGMPLERVVVRPLAYRGRAEIEVHRSGVAIAVTGEGTFFIPQEAITLVGRAQGAIDRAVEPDGLIVIQWNLGPENSVETFLRIVNPAARAELLEAIQSIATTAHATREEHK